MEISSVFSATANESASLVAQRRQEIAPKDGQVSVTGTLINYIGKTTSDDGKVKNANLDRPPAPVEKRSPKDPKKKWNEDINMYIHIDSISPVENKVERLVDPKSGNVHYNVAIECKVLGEEDRKYLEDNAAHAWSHEDDDSMFLRNFVNQDGTLVSRYTKTYASGDEVKMTAPDRKTNNLFRLRVDETSTIFKVQPGAPLRFYNVSPVAFLKVVEEEVKEENEEGAASVGEVVQTDAVPPPVRRKEKRLRVYIKFQCKGHVTLGEDYDPTLERSEREHASKNKDLHQLAPVERFRENENCIPHNAYFYVSGGYETRSNGDPKMKGVCIIRERPTGDATHLPVENFVRTSNDNVTPWLKLSFDVFQFIGKPDRNTFDQYNVVMIDTDSNDTNWRKFGITDPHIYSYIMAANRTLPLHLEGQLWTSSVLNNPSNDPKTIRNKEEVARMQGYYTYGVKSMVVDFLRHFRTHGIRVSKDWVEHDFRGSAVTNAKGKRSITLRPADPTKANPVNTGGLMGSILALGNGKMLTSDITGDEYAVNHAWEGNLLSLLEPDTHDFYVLLSHPLTAEERIEYARGEHGPFADQWLDSIVGDDNGAYYWIYAVRKNVKMAPDFYTLNKPPVAVEAAPTTPVKRETRKTARQSESESESSVSNSTPSRRTRRRRGEEEFSEH